LQVANAGPGLGKALRASPRAFGLNLVLQLALHILPPISFFVPVLTGFITGWQIKARAGDAAVLGLGMGGLMFVLCCAVGAGLMIVFPSVGFIPIVLVASVLVVHLATFAGVGAMIGGHYARKDESYTVPTE
jgi:hypothetical protein